MSKLLFSSGLLYHKHKMNPQQLGGQPQPVQPSDPSLPQQPYYGQPAGVPVQPQPSADPSLANAQPPQPAYPPQQAGDGLQPNTQPASQQQPPIEHTPYDFITNPTPEPKKSMLPSGSSVMQRALIFGGGMAMLIILAVIVMSLLSGGGNNTQLVTVAQQQNELVRVATLGSQSASSQETKNFALTSQLGLSTSQQQLLAYLSNHGTKVGTKQLALTQNPSTDAQLADAKAASSFDQAFNTVMKTQLTAYAQSLTSAYESTNSKSAKELISKEFDAAKLLLEQLEKN